MSGHAMQYRGQKILNRTWSVVAHLVDDVEPDLLSTVAPMGATGTRTKIFSQNR